MEYLEGQTLRDRLAQGTVPLKQAIQWAVEIAEALAEAHEKGIIHRDLKPANIMLLRTGHAKVMDFGLAKQVSVLPGSGDQEDTLTALTREGTTVGTVPYMSPEQVQGKTVDLRSDLFSLGIVIYEMLTGVNPFKRELGFDTAEAILKEVQAPISKYRDDVPQPLVILVNRLLAKDPKDRYQRAREVTDTLQQVIDEAFGQQIVITRAAFARIQTALKKPVYLIPLILVLAVAAYFSIQGVKTYQKSKWVRDVALPQIEKLAEKEDNYPAYRLLRQAERYLPDDPRLQSLWQRLAVPVSVLSTPPGAEIYMADARAAKDSEWELLGRSPIENVRIPNTLIRWRVVKQGFETIEVASSASWPRHFILQPQGTLPSDMIYIPRGSYAFGSLAPVPLEDYWLDKYEVTNRKFREFVSAGGYQKREYWKQPFLKGSRVLSWEEAMAEFRDATGRPGPATWELGTYPEGKADFPVGGVSWYEAAAYAAFAGKSLPTIYHWYNAAGIMSLFYPTAMLSNMNGAAAAMVGSFRSLGAYGTYDLAGNVSEWCWNQTGSNRYLLGGAYSDPLYMFSESNNMPPFDRSATNGFRCAKYKEPLSETVTSPIQRHFRDFSKEKPVSDQVFQLYKSIYTYDRGELKAAVEAVNDSSEYWRMEKISFNAAYGNERVPAYLFLPKQASPPYQTVVYFPGSHAVRLRSSNDILVSYLDFIIRSGRAVLYPIYKNTYERHIEISSPGPNFERDLIIWYSKDLSRSIDYLETRPEINSKKLAYYGISMGGRLGPILTAIEGRFKTSILLAGGMSQQKTLPEVDAVNFAPRARIPVLMLNGRYDYAFPLETSQIPLFRLLGTPDIDKRHVILESGHVPPRQAMIKEILDWLDRYLGPVSLK